MEEKILEDVKRYDSHADAGAVEKLIKHFGIALQDSDGKWVAMTDPQEVERVEHWGEKHLGLSKEQAKSEVAAVGKEMHGDRHKHRVTFCYLLAKRAGKLNHLP